MDRRINKSKVKFDPVMGHYTHEGATMVQVEINVTDIEIPMDDEADEDG